MKRRDKLPELLAPAGDFDALVAAVAAGADAVYVGGKSFSARAFAKNFDIDELRRAALYCHLHSVKLYVTVNTLIYDKELDTLGEYVAELYNIGVDAVITADAGALSLISSVAPHLPLHASTQASVHNTYGAEAVASLGCTRVVLARELSLENIKSVTSESSVETEVFLHGALCVCHSGQCLFSSLVGGRSGNRGECAQPCRLPYGKGYPLSLSDLSLADHIPELIDSGVASLKIEGRMKSPDYVYGVTRIYRRLFDQGRGATAEEHRELARIFSRGGFTDGYFTGNTENMTGVRSFDDKKNTRELEKGSFTPRKVPISARARFKLGEPSSLTLTLGDSTVTAVGDAPGAAISAPLTECDLKARLSKMGNTFFTLQDSDIEIELDGGVNLAPSAINALRRDCVAMLEAHIGTMDREAISYSPRAFNVTGKNTKKQRTALFLNARVASAVFSKVGYDGFDRVFLPLWQIDAPAVDERVGVYIPPVVTDSEMSGIKELLLSARERGYKWALVGNIGQISLARELGFSVFGDFRLNVTNSLSAAAYEKMGVEGLVLSPEITLPMARDIGGYEICYGRIPLMLLERCYMKESFGCDRCDKCALTDRTGAAFPLMREYGHRNLLLNSAVTYMGDRRAELDSYRINGAHFIFSVEKPDEVIKVMRAYARGEAMPLSCQVRRIGKR